MAEAERDDEWIAKRAYALWEEEGRPHGRHDAHWQEAANAWAGLQADTKKTKAAAPRRTAKAKTVEKQEGADIDPPAPAKSQPRGRRKG